MNDMMAILNSLLKSGRVVDLFALIRFMYRIGNPVVQDDFYEKVNNYCVNNGLAEEYLNRTYDDDPIPVALLKELELEQFIPTDIGTNSEYFRYLDEEKTLSIQAVTNYDEAYDYFDRMYGNDLIMTLKVDGINTKKLIMGEELKLGLSRGRSGVGFDLTKNILKVLPRYYAGLVDETKVYSEFFVDSKALDYLRAKYDPKGYKTEKSSAISMLRVEHEKEDYQHLRGLTFAAEGLGTKISENMEILKTLGLSTVPYIKISKEEIPRSREEFVPWLKSKLDEMFTLGSGIPSDGVVVDADDLLFTGSIKNQYSSRNIALKMEYWSFDYYKGKVLDIVIEQKRVRASCRVKIQPMTTNDKTEARVINVFNPDILVRNGIRKGSDIYFERNSGAVNIMLHGGRLQSVLLESPEE